MYEYITAPNLCKKVLRSVKWEFSIGDQIEENSLLCTLVIDTEEFSLLSEILNQKLFVSEKKQIYSHVVGILHKVNSVEEILTTNIVCVVRKESGSQREDEIFECSHDIEYGGICGECGKMLEE